MDFARIRLNHTGQKRVLFCITHQFDDGWVRCARYLELYSPMGRIKDSKSLIALTQDNLN